MISNEMFGSDIIRVRINGYLKNITDSENLNIDVTAIKNKNGIVYSLDDVKTSIKFKDKDVMLIREGEDFINTFVFNDNKSKCNYFLKDNGYELNLNIDCSLIDIKDNSLLIKYTILDTSCEYEYKIEMSELL